MFGNYLEAVIVVLIMAGMGVLIWRGGAKNPVGTGGLNHKLIHIDGEVKKFGGEVAGMKQQMGEIEARIEDIDKRAAKSADIRRLERQFEELAKTVAASREEDAAMGASLEHIRRQIDLLYQFIVEKGMK